MKSIRALTFDLDNTLWETDLSILNAEDVMAAHLRALTPAAWMADFNLETFRAVRQQIVHEQPDIAHNLTVVRRQTLIRWFQHQGVTEVQAEELAEEGFQVFYDERQKVKPYPGTVETLSHLSQAYPLAAITNGNADLMAMPLGEYFQFSLQSQHFPKPKPDPVMFEEALARLNIEAHECLHIGDDIEHDVIGASCVGMKTVWFNTHGRTSEEAVLADHSITRLEQLVDLLKPHD
jgi:FMN hydrolase / 5-amino-6-(5-phospho-D-ribitylamino)uracil phosphatase